MQDRTTYISKESGAIAGVRKLTIKHKVKQRNHATQETSEGPHHTPIRQISNKDTHKKKLEPTKQKQ